MTHNTWSGTKPEFTEECILITATKYANKEHWDYNSWLIVKQDGETETGEYGWYYALCDIDGEEWGDLADLTAKKYLTMPLLK
jgi:hypothetical protein